MEADDEERLLRSAAIQNANTIRQVRQRAEQELIRAKEALEQKTQELAHSLAMMRATLQSATDGILVTDELGRVTDFNERYVVMWQIPRDRLDERSHRRIVEAVCRQLADPQRFVARIEDIYATSPKESFDVLEFVDGRVFERASRVQVLDERNVGRVWSFRDVTEYRRTEEALRQAAEDRKQLLDSERAARSEAERASAMKDEFLATLSHELRTPLSAILGWAHILRVRSLSQAELHQGLEVIEQNARMQTRLIEDLLDMSRIISGKMRLEIQPVEPLLFIEAAIETVRPAAEAKGIGLSTLVDPACGPIAGDPSRLQQVIWNLLSNAIKFTERNGRVQVVLERLRSHVEIRVADTGIGIKPEFLPHVFDRFRQADGSTARTARGLGLGLSIVKHLVELHGGTVLVNSPGVGGGTTFTIRLPLTVVREAADDRGRLRADGSTDISVDFKYSDLSGVTVLVVDDQPDARELIKHVLGECHARVLTATSAAEALAAVEAGRPNVLVSDIGMPDVDGYELLRRVRALGHARGGGLPAIALTAFARSEDRTRALRAGFLVHVSKPVEPSELVATVASVVGRTGQPAM